ncbi:MAG: hypothetical protein EXS48_01850 [Candidatus Staskawiczbacteria bacterium]|nr:hypothetical protein [Candidatus Staskawiczbacteria bacterium]
MINYTLCQWLGPKKVRRLGFVWANTQEDAYEKIGMTIVDGDNRKHPYLRGVTFWLDSRLLITGELKEFRSSTDFISRFSEIQGKK